MIATLPMSDVPTEPGRLDRARLRADADSLRQQCDLMEAAGRTRVPVATAALRRLAAMADRIADGN